MNQNQTQNLKKKTKFCDYYQIKQCDGICGGLETIEKYQVKIDQIVAILSGKTKIIQKHLQTKIEIAIKNQNFALAALWRDKLFNLQKSVEAQKVVLENTEDLDLFNLVIQNVENETILGSVFVQNIREGRIVNVGNFLLNITFENQEKEEIIMSFWQRFLLGYTVLNANIAPIYLQTFWEEV